MFPFAERDRSKASHWSVSRAATECGCPPPDARASRLELTEAITRRPRTVPQTRALIQAPGGDSRRLATHEEPTRERFAHVTDISARRMEVGGVGHLPWTGCLHRSR